MNIDVNVLCLSVCRLTPYVYWSTVHHVRWKTTHCQNVIAHSLLGSCWRQVSFNPDSGLAPGSTNMHNEAIASLAF